ncbi:unnamed protein product, partial [Closterium sp. NIES-65]
RCARVRTVGRTGTVRRSRRGGAPPVAATLASPRPRTAVLTRVCSWSAMRTASALRTRRGRRRVCVTLASPCEMMASRALRLHPGLHPSSCHLLPATAAAHGAKRRTPRATALMCARDCGENAYCEKEQELAVCHCNWGYAMTDAGCVDTCILQACGENGRCVKDEAGMASCVCDVGFTLMGDGRTCTENCILKRCQALTSDCMKYEDGTAYCVCKPGYTLLYGTCVGPATCGNCPSLATCTLVSSTRKAPYCVCPAGFGMTATGCVRGALPTVSSASLTFYNQPGFTLTPSTYTLRVRYSGCTNLPSTIGLNVRSYWRVDRAPGGAGHCQFVNAYRFANCVTQVAQLPALSLSGIAAASVS